jgi:hypothetical protein
MNSKEYYIAMTMFYITLFSKCFIFKSSEEKVCEITLSNDHKNPGVK